MPSIWSSYRTIKHYFSVYDVHVKAIRKLNDTFTREKSCSSIVVSSFARICRDVVKQANGTPENLLNFA